MFRLAVVVLLALYCAAQDNSSTITCGTASTSVLTSLAQCTLNVKEKGSSLNTIWTYFDMKPGSADATITNVSPPNGTTSDTFQFTVTVGALTGPFNIVSNKLPGVTFLYTVFDTPDATSTLQCTSYDDDSVLHYVEAGKSAYCVVIPQKNGTAIYATPGIFKFAPLDLFTFTSIAPAVIDNKFRFTATAKSTSTVTSITDGFGAWNMTITNIPDSTSTLKCTDQQIQVGASITCDIIPKTKGSVVYTNARNFNMSGGNPETVVPKISGYANSFNALVWTVGPASGIYTISDGINTQEVDVWDTPDTNSDFACGEGEGLPISKDKHLMMGVGGTFNCVIRPKKDSSTTRVYARSDIFSINVIDKNGLAMKSGSYTPEGKEPGKGGVNPDKVSNEFTFSFTSTQAYGDANYLQINNNVNQPLFVDFVPLDTPDATSTLTCDNSTVEAGDVINCLLNYTLKGEPAFVSSSSISLGDDDNDGTFSDLSYKVHYHFTFTYTAGPHNQAVVITDGMGHTFNVRVTGGTNPLSAGVIVAIVAAALIVLGAIAFCFQRQRKKISEKQPLLDERDSN